VFDDPNLLANAGLAPLLALAGRAGLPGLLGGVAPAGPCGANAATKAMCLVAGMAAGADSIDDMDLLRDGAMETVFGGVRAPSTLGSFLRSFTWGNVRQLDRAHRGLTAALARDPRLLPGREVLAFIDIDSTQERVYGYQKEGAAFGHAKVQGKSLLLRGLNPLISVISTPLAAPVLGPVRLRGGSAGSARGAASLAAEAVGAAREAGCTEEGAGHRPADRPPSPRPQRQGRPGSGRAVPRLPSPRRLHRLPVRDAPVRRPAPRPCHRRAGHRRPERRPPRPPAIC
jgi:hypothetical protein